ncbi:MAG: TonB family protein [Candidatus Aminicenantes bacterium]|nr:TonB family protein [Candidatus Aminicenantes bacterium]
MFEDCLPAPKKNSRPPRDKAIGALVTLLFHGILGIAIYHGRFTVKILPFEKEEVRAVMLVPPLKVNIPKIVGGRGLTAEPSGLPEKAGPPGTERPAEDVRQEPAAGLGTPAKAPPGEAPRTAAGAGSAIPSLSSKYQEMIDKPKPAGESGLTIALAPPGTPPGPPGVGGGPPLPDFSKYGRGAYGGGGYGGGGGRGGSGTGGRQRVGVSIALKGYDLLPWASVVVDRIQRFWNLPAVPELPDPAKVRLIVVIKKSGELDSIEILEGTSVEVLDRAALEAIRAGFPFPALPADFPGDLLEITFEFVYND